MLSLLTLILGIVAYMFEGFTIATLWNWFVYPTFSDLPLMTIPIAMGLALLIRFVVISFSKGNSQTMTALRSEVGDMFEKGAEKKDFSSDEEAKQYAMTAWKDLLAKNRITNYVRIAKFSIMVAGCTLFLFFGYVIHHFIY